MRAVAVFEPHVLHACCSSFTLIKCVSVCERTILLPLWSVIVIKSSHNLIVFDISPETLKTGRRREESEERRGEEKTSWGKHSPVVKGFKSWRLFLMWWQLYFHTNFQASPCESDSSVCVRYTGNLPPAEMGGWKLGQYILVSWADLLQLNLWILLWAVQASIVKSAHI